MEYQEFKRKRNGVGTGNEEKKVVVLKITETKWKGHDMQILSQDYIMWLPGAAAEGRAKAGLGIVLKQINVKIIVVEYSYLE